MWEITINVKVSESTKVVHVFSALSQRPHSMWWLSWHKCDTPFKSYGFRPVRPKTVVNSIMFLFLTFNVIFPLTFIRNPQLKLSHGL